MASGLKIGSQPFAQDDHEHYRNLPQLKSHPTPSPHADDSPRAAGRMASDSTQCSSTSDCTHDAMCVDGQCFCYETGTICPAKPKPAPAKDYPDLQTPLSDSSQSSLEATYCRRDDDCPLQAVCYDTGTTEHKRCFCYTTRVYCNATRKLQENPCGDGCPANTFCDPSFGCRPACPGDGCKVPGSNGIGCYNDEDCSFHDYSYCVDDGSGLKHCFCLDTGDFCDSRLDYEDDTIPMSSSNATRCYNDEDCPEFASCEDDGSGFTHCFCLETGDFCKSKLKLQENNTQPEVRSTTPSDSLGHGVIHRDEIHKIINMTAANQTMASPRSPAATRPQSCCTSSCPWGSSSSSASSSPSSVSVVSASTDWGPKRSSEAVVKSGDGVMLLDRMNNINKNPTYFVSPGDDPTQRKFLVREICMDHVMLVDVVGEGAFGQVYRGELHCPESNTNQLVAVKVLKENVSNEIREDFEREVEIMSAFDHDNILKLVGVVTQNAGQSPYMIFEYMVHGDLAELLRKNDPALLKKDSGVIRLQKPDLVDIATQIANGMSYLTSQHFVHRDLATRNCLVGEGLVVKISDFGMSRDIYTCDYYKIGGSRMLPVRWMSPESVKYGRFTSESDAWAYGVVLWEIFSYGRQPYYGHSNEEVVRFLDAGILLQRPEDCPSTVYHIMLGCWKADPKERLTFDKIHKHLQDYHQRLVKMAASQSQPTTPVAGEGGGDMQVKLPPVLNASPDPQHKFTDSDLQPDVDEEAKTLQEEQQSKEAESLQSEPSVKVVVNGDAAVKPQPQQQQQGRGVDVQAKFTQEQETVVFSTRPRNKQALKGTRSDPQGGVKQGLFSASQPAALAESSRASSGSLTQHRVQPLPDQLQPLEMSDGPEGVFQVKLPPPSSSPPSQAVPKPLPEVQVTLSDAFPSPPASAKCHGKGHSASLEKLTGLDSGFNSGEQEFDAAGVADSSSTTTTTTACMVSTTTPPLVHSSLPVSNVIVEAPSSIVCTSQHTVV